MNILRISSGHAPSTETIKLNCLLGTSDGPCWLAKACKIRLQKNLLRVSHWSNQAKGLFGHAAKNGLLEAVTNGLLWKSEG